MSTRSLVVTGLKPTGRLHLGNLLGAIHPLLELSKDPSNEVVSFVADLHALTVEHDPAELRSRTLELATTLLACGVRPGSLYVQSALPAHTELSYLLECTATHGEMARMIQFKEKSSGSTSVRFSLLSYPALMAADILLHGADRVPVGEDQRQHLELTRTLAERFNSRYGPVFVVPEGITPPTAARVRDLRDPSAKMGKSASSEAGTLYLLDSPEEIASKLRRAVTDPDPVLSYDPSARPGVANLAEILASLTGRTPEEALAGLSGGAALKGEVTEVVVAALRPVQERYRELAEDPSLVATSLAEGLASVSPGAAARVERVRTAMGLL